VPIQSQIQISGDTLLSAVIRLTILPGDGDEIADGFDVRCRPKRCRYFAVSTFCCCNCLSLLLSSSWVFSSSRATFDRAMQTLCLPTSCRDDEALPIIVDAAVLQLIVHPLTFCAFCMLVNSEPTVFVVLAAAWWTCHLLIWFVYFHFLSFSSIFLIMCPDFLPSCLCQILPKLLHSYPHFFSLFFGMLLSPFLPSCSFVIYKDYNCISLSFQLSSCIDLFCSIFCLSSGTSLSPQLSFFTDMLCLLFCLPIYTSLSPDLFLFTDMPCLLLCLPMCTSLSLRFSSFIYLL